MRILIAGIILCVVAIVVIAMNYHSKKRLLKNLQNMMDEAIAGNYEVTKLDESMFSLLENSMHRFLDDCESSAQNINEQRHRIQTLISDISHQTITPISNILLYTELLGEKDTKREYIEEVAAIQNQTEKLSFLINSLIEMSRLENGIIKVHTKRQEIQPILEAIRTQIHANAEEKQITFEVKSTTELAVFDKKWTTEAVYNLVDNAVKYTEQGGKVSVKVIPYSMFVRIDVTDNGIGISEEEINKIFGRFYRSQEVSEKEGVGIGLYLAREIVTVQGGYMKVESKKKEGSTFSVFLPH